MRKLKLLGIFLIMGIGFSCNNDDGPTQQQEAADLARMLSQIENMASSAPCNDSSEWTFTSYGNKACGGPVGYIAYSSRIDTFLFLEKIEQHRIAQLRFNEKWGMVSDCSAPLEPAGVVCEEGNPVFEY